MAEYTKSYHDITPKEAAALIVDASIASDNNIFEGDVSAGLIACFEELTKEQTWKVLNKLATTNQSLESFITLDMLRKA